MPPNQLLRIGHREGIAAFRLLLVRGRVYPDTRCQVGL